MLPMDFVSIVDTESTRFRDVLAETDLRSKVPSCPEWDAGDLLWHLTEVQHFWASIVGGLLEDRGDVPELERPTDAELLDLFDEQSVRLIGALRSQPADAECWSWSTKGRSVGWVRRRQAHEALIHRADAELAAGLAPEADPAVGADGIDELLTNWYDPDLPEWATFVDDTDTVRLTTRDRTWDLRFGRFIGTSPHTGTAYDNDDVMLVDDVAAPGLTITGPADKLDFWLWGRGDTDPLTLSGDGALAARLRDVIAGSTQ